MDYNSFTVRLLDWFEANANDLPWRRTYDPYQVWISEIMAQQTQMGRVVPYFRRWVSRFPDVKSLSQASEDTVLSLWEGLGYYSRARNLLKAGKIISRDYGGVFPSSHDAILSLPGIGPYTAAAISGIAFNEPYVCVDANVKRVFSRWCDFDFRVDSTELKKNVQAAAIAALPEGQARQYNQALMEFGQRICGKKPQCDMCPFSDLCLACERGVALKRPVPATPKDVKQIVMATGVLLHEHKVLIQKRKADDVWPGLWEFPGGGVEPGEEPHEAVVREYMEEVGLGIEVQEKISTIRFSYTRFRVTMHAFLCSASDISPEPVFNEADQGLFTDFFELDDYAFPSGHRKLIREMKSDIRFSSLFTLPN